MLYILEFRLPPSGSYTSVHQTNNLPRFVVRFSSSTVQRYGSWGVAVGYPSPLVPKLYIWWRVAFDPLSLGLASDGDIPESLSTPETTLGEDT
jgi:hypothetical protein